MPFLCWLVVGVPAPKLNPLTEAAHDRWSVSRQWVFSPSVLEALRHLLPPGAAGDAKTWQANLSSLHKRVIAVSVVEPAFLNDDPLQPLSHAEQSWLQYWHMVAGVGPGRSLEMQVFRVLHSVALRENPLVRVAGGSVCFPKTLFFNVTQSQAEELMSQNIETQDPGDNMAVQRWLTSLDTPLQAHSIPSLCMKMPAPHAVLVGRGVWGSLACPMASA